MITLRNLTINNSPADYLPSPGLLNALEVAYMLQRPLLLTGEPGTGKTQFAYWVADQLAQTNAFRPTPYVYNTKTSSTAKDLFYHYDAIAHFREGRVGGAEDFIQLKALGLAIASAAGRLDLPTLSPAIVQKSGIADGPIGSVVLIDEIDKAARVVPNDLLTEIENYEFEITELNQLIRLTAEAQRRNIIIILTSNFEKNLPDAFLRRCIYFHIEFPDKDRLFEIIIRRLDVSRDDYGDIRKTGRRLLPLPGLSQSQQAAVDFRDSSTGSVCLQQRPAAGPGVFSSAPKQFVHDERLLKWLPILINRKRRSRPS